MTTIMSMSHIFMVVEEESIHIDLQSMRKKEVKMKNMPETFLGEVRIKEVVLLEPRTQRLSYEDGSTIFQWSSSYRRVPRMDY
jgi:hypothetical protein